MKLHLERVTLSPSLSSSPVKSFETFDHFDLLVMDIHFCESNVSLVVRAKLTKVEATQSKTYLSLSH